MNYAAKWNKLDSIIFFLESKIGQIKDAVKDSKDDDPGVELMIRAETEHLQSENETLKKREFPLRLIEEDGVFFCPECKAVLADPSVKYCGFCGHRVVNDISILRM